MNTPVRLTAYATALALAFGAAWGVGSAVGAPATVAAAGHGAEHGGSDGGSGHGEAGRGESGHGESGHGDGHAHDAGTVESGGLTATAAGYTLVPGATTFNGPGELAFTITGSDGAPVTAYDVEHDKQLHLVVVRRDGTGFQHLHPTLGPDGVWRTPLTLPAGGVYRAYADFTPTGGPPLVLGTDLFAPGEFVPAELPPSRVSLVDGYQVRLDGDLVPGGPSQVFATISRDGAAVTDLEPYLGAFGHLVALRGSDLSYLHVHPDAAPPAPADRAGPGIAFTAEVPTAGSYRLFLDFQHGGVVRTAEFTITTREGA